MLSESKHYNSSSRVDDNLCKKKQRGLKTVIVINNQLAVDHYQALRRLLITSVSAAGNKTELMMRTVDLFITHIVLVVTQVIRIECQLICSFICTLVQRYGYVFVMRKVVPEHVCSSFHVTYIVDLEFDTNEGSLPISLAIMKLFKMTAYIYMFALCVSYSPFYLINPEA